MERVGRNKVRDREEGGGEREREGGGRKGGEIE